MWLRPEWRSHGNSEAEVNKGCGQTAFAMNGMLYWIILMVNAIEKAHVSIIV